MSATIESTVNFFEFGGHLDLNSPLGLNAALRRATSECGRRRRWAELVADLVLDALAARAEFEMLPKRTPAQHKEHYLGIARKVEELLKEIAEEGAHGGYYGIGGGLELEGELRQLAESAKDAAEVPRLSRPEAGDALRTYVAREISHSFHRHTQRFRHAAGASLLNAVFPDNKETKDASYMQSIARNLRLE